MTFTFYRADNRAPDVIAAAGFQGRVPMSLETTHALIGRALIDPRPEPALALPAGEKPMSQALAAQGSPALLGLGAMYNAIRNERSHGTTHVSTARDDGCMGADAQHFYRIELPMSRLYAWDADGNGLRATPRVVEASDGIHQGSIRPVLLTDSERLQDARMIAISDRAGEIAFQTPIPAAWVAQTRERVQAGQPERAWTDMPSSPAREAAAAAATAQPTPSATPASAPPASMTPALEPQTPAMPLPPKPAALVQHPYAHPGHDRHPLYAQALQGLTAAAAPGLRTSAERTAAAAALADAAHSAVPPMRSIDHVTAGANGRLFAVQGALGDARSQIAYADPGAQGQATAPGPSHGASAAAQAPAVPGQDNAACARGSVQQLAKMFDAQAEQASQGPAGPRRM